MSTNNDEGWEILAPFMILGTVAVGFAGAVARYAVGKLASKLRLL